MLHHEPKQLKCHEYSKNKKNGNGLIALKL